MDNNAKYQGSQVARLNLRLLTGALNALHNLVSATDQEIRANAS